MIVLRVIGQTLVWMLLLAPAILLAQWPRHEPLPPGYGELRLSLVHTTQRLKPCRRLSPAELQALPPNMRNVEQCERARAPARTWIELAGRPLLDATVMPKGLHNDGRVYLHRRWSMPAGRYSLVLGLRDTPGEGDPDHEHRFELDLKPSASALLLVGDGTVQLLAGGAAGASP